MVVSSIRNMDFIFFEKQEGSLCAQHALNTLLQGSYFTAVDLAEIARRLDNQERQVMAEGGIDNPEYLRTLQGNSHNMDDSGYFSVQVMEEALAVWNLNVVPFGHANAAHLRDNPTLGQAYICNFREHWFTIRKLGEQWFNLNSMLVGPDLISDTFLAMFLTQLQHENYSIFVVDGALPRCEANDILSQHPVSCNELAQARREADKRHNTGEGDPELQAALELSRRQIEDEDAALQAALTASRQEGASMEQDNTQDSDEERLRKAIALSVAENDGESSSGRDHPVPSPVMHCPAGEMADPEQMRKRRALFLDKLQQNPQ